MYFNPGAILSLPTLVLKVSNHNFALYITYLFPIILYLIFLDYPVNVKIF